MSEIILDEAVGYQSPGIAIARPCNSQRVNVHERATVRINANVAAATHEQREGTLGQRRRPTPYQQLSYASRTLTYVSADTPTGSSLDVEGVCQ